VIEYPGAGAFSLGQDEDNEDNDANDDTEDGTDAVVQSPGDKIDFMFF